MDEKKYSDADAKVSNNSFGYKWDTLYKGRILAGITGLGALVSSMGLPLVVGSYLLANCTRADDNLEIRNVVNSSYGAGILNLSHNLSGVENGVIGVDDSTWEGRPPSQIQPEMKIITKPY